MRRTVIAVVGLALAATPPFAAPALAGSAAAPPSGSAEVLARGQLSPLSLAVNRRGVVWFSQNFAGQLMRVPPGGRPVLMHQAGQGTEVGGVTVRGRRVMFVTTSPEGNTRLKVRRPSGRVTSLANLSRHERRRNPDAGNTYGITDLEPECAEQWPTEQLGPVTYTGIVESHPYATLARGRTTFVADAAANAILAVRRGNVRTVAVLPPQPFTIPDNAEELGVPACAAGHVYHFEPVPTDVEMRRGSLYVTTLPGGPEDPSLGARAAVHRVDPATGAVDTLVTGLLSATGLAVAPNGDMYVAQLFRNRVARIPAGTSTPRVWARSRMPGDVEFRSGRVWGTRRVLVGLGGPDARPGGQVVRWRR